MAKERESHWYETALVGLMLSDGSAITLLADRLASHWWQDELCGNAFRALVALRSVGAGTTPKDVSLRLLRDGIEENHFVKLEKLKADGCLLQSAENYLQELLDIDNRRMAKKTLIEALQLLESGQTELDDVFAAIEESRRKLSTCITTWEHVSDAIVSAAEEGRKPNKLHRLSTGNEAINRLLTGGINVGSLTVIAARTSVGKTTIAMQMAEGISEDHKVLFISLEMDRISIAKRLIAYFDGPNFDEMSISPITHESFKSAIDIASLTRTRNLHISSSRSVLIDNLEAQIRLAARDGFKAVFLDYLAFIKHRDTKMFKRDQVSDITKRLKTLALQEGIAIVLLQQLNRDVADKDRPSLANLRDSGSIEEDADVVVFAFKIDDGLGRTLEVAKNRNGELLCTDFEFNGSKFRYETKASEWQP